MVEERDLNPGERVYIEIISQNKLNYGGSKNCVLIQDCDTEKKLSFFTNTKEYLSEKVTPLPEENEDYEEKRQNNFL